MLQSVPWLQRTINTIHFHTGNELSIFTLIGLSNVTKWFPEYCASCKLHVVVTHSAQRLYTGCPRMHKHSNYPWLGRLRTHQCQSLPLCCIDSTVQEKQQQPIIRPRGDPTTAYRSRTCSITQGICPNTWRDFHWTLSLLCFSKHQLCLHANL